MSTLITFLSGKKTFIVSLLIFVVSILKYMGIVDEQTFQFLIGLLGSGGFITARLAIKKIEKK